MGQIAGGRRNLDFLMMMDFGFGSGMISAFFLNELTRLTFYPHESDLPPRPVFVRLVPNVPSPDLPGGSP